MAPRTKPVDAVFIGAGLTMSIIAEALTDAGLGVLVLERSPWRDLSDDGASANDLLEDFSCSTLTFRNAPGQTALPLRKPRSFPAGEGDGRIWRCLPADLRMRSHTLERYGASAIAEDMTIQDWPVGYDELEPCFDRLEYAFGVSGKAGNLQGRVQPGGNPFEGPRRRDYPRPPMSVSHAPALFGRAAAELGHHPFPSPSTSLSQAFANPPDSKARPWTSIPPALRRKPNFTLKTGCEVLKINIDSERRRATGVTYVDALGREIFQPAEIVVLSAGVLDNVRLLLLSRIGQPYDVRTGLGAIGRNYACPIQSKVHAFFEDELTPPVLGTDGLSLAVDDFNGDNFDHCGKGFIGGGHIRLGTTGTRPIGLQPTPPGTPTWGAGWKKAAAHWGLRTTMIECHGAVTARRTNFLDLDPTYRDALDRPLLRMTFDFPDNDKRMSAYLTGRAVEIAQAMGARRLKPEAPKAASSIASSQTPHGTGGAIMGDDPRTSAVNRYLQSWNVANLFVTGSASLPQNPGYDPVGAASALAYWCADAIRTRYLKSPGPMVQA